MNKVGLSFRPEVPLHRGRAAHLTALLAGDAAQFEALPCHRLGVRVHFCAGSVATEHCQRKTTQRLQPHRWFEHVHRQKHGSSGRFYGSNTPASRKFPKTRSVIRSVIIGTRLTELLGRGSEQQLQVSDWKEKSKTHQTESRAETPAAAASSPSHRNLLCLRNHKL